MRHILNLTYKLLKTCELLSVKLWQQFTNVIITLMVITSWMAVDHLDTESYRWQWTVTWGLKRRRSCWQPKTTDSTDSKAPEKPSVDQLHRDRSHHRLIYCADDDGPVMMMGQCSTEMKWPRQARCDEVDQTVLDWPHSHLSIVAG